MLSRDHYAVLGVSPDADAQTIEASFRHLCRRYHPDLNPGDSGASAAFERIKLAYSVLSDATERDRYDRDGRPPADGIEFAGPGTISAGRGDGEEGTYGELFRALRDHARRAGPQRGGDLHAAVSSRLIDAERGRRTTTQLRRMVPCTECRATGRVRMRQLSPCVACAGSGKEVFGRGPLTLAVPCADCGGEGLHAGVACRPCNGSGLVRRDETVAIQIPAGIVDGQTITIAGGGHYGVRGGPPGDLVVACRVAADPRFERRGPHLVTELRLSVSEAILGARIAVPTLEGKTVALRVPPGTANGQQLRLRGQGLEMPDGRAGDLLLRVEIWLPGIVDEDAKRLLRQFSERTGKPPRSNSERATVRR